MLISIFRITLLLFGLASLGRSTDVIVLPVLFKDSFKAVIQLATLNAFTPSHLAFLERPTASIGIFLTSIEATMQTEGLLKQSQQLAVELQMQEKDCSRQMSSLLRRPNSWPTER